MLWILIPILTVVYVAVGFVTTAAFYYWQRSQITRDGFDGEVIFWGVMVLLLWPAVLAGVAAKEGFSAAMRACLTAGRRYSFWHHRYRIAEQRTKMMKEDEKRLRSFDRPAEMTTALIQMNAYKPCKSCWGSGCPQCADTGIVREKKRG